MSSRKRTSEYAPSTGRSGKKSKPRRGEHMAQAPIQKQRSAGAAHTTSSLAQRHPSAVHTAICAALVVLILIAFWPVRLNDFIHLDDYTYIVQNPQVTKGLTGEGLLWAFTTHYASNWHPLTWISHMIDCQLFGLNPMGHHGVNVLLHIGNVLLLYLFLSRTTGAVWPSAFVALVFACHPLHVESVAWASERKDVLSTCFLLLTLHAYVRYVRQGSLPTYLLVVALFTLWLFTKPMLVTLPCLLLLLDVWPLARIDLSRHSTAPKWRMIGRLLLEKSPLLALSAVSSLATIWAQGTGAATASMETWLLRSRLTGILVSYLFYLKKLVWPENLAVLYPLPHPPVSLWAGAAAFLALLMVSVWVVLRLRKQTYLAVGWFWYLGMLVPVIGLVQVGSQFAADRYTYVPMNGILVACAWAISEWTAKWRHRTGILAVGTAGIALLCVVGTRQQVGLWRDSQTLFKHTLRAHAKINSHF